MIVDSSPSLPTNAYLLTRGTSLAFGVPATSTAGRPSRPSRTACSPVGRNEFRITRIVFGGFFLGLTRYLVKQADKETKGQTSIVRSREEVRPFESPGCRGIAIYMPWSFARHLGGLRKDPAIQHSQRTRDVPAVR